MLQGGRLALAGTCARQAWALAAAANDMLSSRALQPSGSACSPSCSMGSAAPGAPSSHRHPPSTRSAATATPAAAAAAAQPPALPKKAGKGKGAAAAAAAAPMAARAPGEGAGSAAVATLDSLAAQYQRSRLQDFYMRVLSRELLLKLNLKSVHELPRVRSVSVAVQAKDVLGQQHVDKWQLLLHALGLEYLSGQPARFAVSSLQYYRKRNAVAGVHIKLHGPAAYDFLEKLVYVVLPSQSAFDGVLLRSVSRAGHLHFRVSRMANFPDFEELFETFEGLGGMHVNVVVDNAALRPQRTQALLTGLQLPVFARRRRPDGRDDADSDEDAAAAAVAALANQSSSEAAAAV